MGALYCLLLLYDAPCRACLSFMKTTHFSREKTQVGNPWLLLRTFSVVSLGCETNLYIDGMDDKNRWTTGKV